LPITIFLQRLAGTDPAKRVEVALEVANELYVRTGWVATPSFPPNAGAVFVGMGGQVAVIDTVGRVFLGSIDIAGQFIRGTASAPLVPVFENLKKIFD
jgi:hypothetical protein